MTPAETIATLKSYLQDVTRAIEDAEKVMDVPQSFERAMDSLFSEANYLAQVGSDWEEMEWDDTFEEMLPT